MSNPVTSIKVGKYRLTAVGLITAIVLLLALVCAAVFGAMTLINGQDRSRPAVNLANNGGEAAPNDLSQVSANVGVEQDGELPLGDLEDLPEDGELIPTEVPTAVPTAEPALRSATIRSLGEIAMQQNLLYSVVNGNEYNFEEMFSEIGAVVGNADYTVADVEGSLGGVATTSGSSKLVTPPSLIDVLKNIGVDMLMVANDHALDGGVNDQQEELKKLTEAGLDYVGGALSAEEKAAPKIVEINGINVAFLAYTESLNGNEKGVDANHLFCVNLITKSTNPTADVAAAKEAGADVVIAYVSWGEMMNRGITDSQKVIARALVMAGVDVIIGYNPHVIQPAMWLENTLADGTVHRTLVLAATGNFLSDQRAHYADSGVIFQFTIQEADDGHFAIVNPVYVPTYVWRTEVEDEENKFRYRTLAVGQWQDEAPEGMSEEDYARVKQVWEEVPTIIPSDVATAISD